MTASPARSSLTPEQAAIVEAGDIDVAVSAGAGTGKTHVLVERYVTLLERCGIPEIVAVTFTEAAAAEMRQRVRHEVLTRAELAAHAPLVDDAIIGTIHSLCLRLLREHRVEAGLDPAVGVLSEDEAELLRLEASAAAIDAAAESDDGRAAIVDALGVYQAGQMLPLMVAQRDDVRAAFDALPWDPEALVAHLRAEVDAACEELLGPLRRSVPSSLDQLASFIVDPSDLLAERILSAREIAGEPAEAGIAAWCERLERIGDVLKLSGGRAAAWSIAVPDVRAEMRHLREDIEARQKRAQAWNEHDEAAALVLPSLRALFEDACARYEARKHEAGGLDFLDLELSAVRLLEEHPEVSRAYRSAWRHLMVDEAQDVSGLQARLIRAITSERTGEEGRPRLFLVGDEKQSIYRFRGAQVRQFRALQAVVRDADGVLLPLSASFRTHATLVEQANELFDVAFEGSEVRMERMTGRPGDPPAAPHLTVLPVSGKAGRRLAEADVVAEEIEALLRAGRPIWDKRARAYRPARAGDVAILLRRYSNVHLFEQALEARGIPFATPSGTGFFTRAEVVDLTNLLRWLVEPDDQIALTGVLRSPLFMLSDRAVYLLRRRGYLQYALREPPEELPLPERERCRFAAVVLDELRGVARTSSAADLVERALVLTGYEASWAAVSGAEQTLANIRKFARLCRDLAHYTTAEVVDYLERRRDELVTREGPAVLDRPDAVQLMTVHGAKGLEFSVVFVPEAHLPAWVSWDAVRWRPGEGVSFTLDRREEEDTTRPRPAFYSLLTSREDLDEREEHLRLFYVAATRARDYLYLSGDEGGSGGGWLPHVHAAVEAGGLRGVDLRPAVDAEERVTRRRSGWLEVEVPPADAEQPFVPDLLARPPVIPLRASTPATALRIVEHQQWARGDGLGLVRGRIIHRAIEASALRPGEAIADLVAAVTLEEARDLDASVRAGLATEAEAMLDGFWASPTGEGVRASGAGAHFEVPFAWHWDGIPVHGQIDLLYRDAASGEWWVIDFKTDRVTPGRERESAEPYLVQLGLYAAALEAATGTRPRAALLFLRTGALHEPGPAALDGALARTREAVDRGLGILAGEEYLDGYEDEASA